jgi:hypothetical protein
MFDNTGTGTDSFKTSVSETAVTNPKVSKQVS